MPLKHPRPRVNRYKKSGKGKTALAAFLVFCCLLMVAGYLLHSSQQKKSELQPPVQSQQKPLQQPKPQQRLSTAAVPTAVVEAVPPLKQDYYTGDLPPTTAAVPSRDKLNTSDSAELAIVVDDMGSSLNEAHALAAIGTPVSFAIIPGLRQFREVADYAAGKGIEVLVHMPMQSKEYPRRRLESNGLLLEYSDEELRSRVLGYLDVLPRAVGANNHMGSGFTEHEGKMRVVLQILKENKLFFLDSITTPKTTGLKVAADLRMHHARRDVFLDNEQNETYIKGQLAQAVARAKKHGRAIAICHPHPMTIATLTKSLPELQSKGVKLVTITRLVH